MCFSGMPPWTLTVQCQLRAESSPWPRAHRISESFMGFRPAFSGACFANLSWYVWYNTHECILEIRWQQRPANLCLPPTCFSHPHDLGNPDLPDFWKPWKWHLVGLNIGVSYFPFSLGCILSPWETLSEWSRFRYMKIHIILLSHDEGWGERTRGSSSTFPSLAAKKSRSQSKAQESEAHLGGWTRPLFHAFVGAELCEGAPHTCREAPEGLWLWLLSVALLGWALLARYGLTLARAMSNSLGLPCARPPAVVAYPDGTAGGSTWLPPRTGIKEPTPKWGWHQAQPARRQAVAGLAVWSMGRYSSSHPFAAQHTLLRCWAQFLCGRCRAGEEGAKGAPGAQLPGTQPGPRWEPFPWAPFPSPGSSSSSTQEIKIRFQPSLRLFPAAVAAPSIPRVPEPPLTVRCPYHTQHQGERLACRVMTQFGGKRRRASPGSHRRAKAPSFHPCHKLLCRGAALQNPELWNLQRCWAGLWGAFCSAKERFPLASLLQPLSALAQADGAGDAIALPKERHLDPGIWWEAEWPEIGSARRRAGRLPGETPAGPWPQPPRPWQPGAAGRATNAPRTRKPEQPAPAGLLMGSGCCCHMLLKVFTSSLLWSLSRLLSSSPPPLNDEVPAFLAIKKNLHLTSVLQKRPENISEVFFNKNSQAWSSLNLIFANVYTCAHTHNFTVISNCNR